jgi:UDP-N-acetyl-D-glucosamine dehydrogenase
MDCVLDVAGLIDRFRSRQAKVGVVGLGYVGLPLLRATAESGFSALGFDVDHGKIELIRQGKSYIRHISGDSLAPLLKTGQLDVTSDFSRIQEVDAIIICVPTPLTRQREPDLTFVVQTTESLQLHLRAGHLVVLESTTYPGTTREIMRPILERSDLVSGRDFFLAYSPEREDPGNGSFETRNIPKVVGGDGEAAGRLACALYDAIVTRSVPVSSPDVAEAVKLTENIFRSVNIALVNELKIVYDAMNIDIWEVIEAAKTKPFGYMPFYPGPGLGGHCIPIDPFYLTWKAREFDLTTRFIELAGQINTAMPRHIVERLVAALSDKAGRAIRGAQILIVGIAYKKNVDDMRESPSFKLISLIESRGARVDYSDPHIPVIAKTREHADMAGRCSVTLSPDSVACYDAVVISTDHDLFDYAMVLQSAKLVVDTRNACRRHGLAGANLVAA